MCEIVDEEVKDVDSLQRRVRLCNTWGVWAGVVIPIHWVTEWDEGGLCIQHIKSNDGGDE